MGLKRDCAFVHSAAIGCAAYSVYSRKKRYLYEWLCRCKYIGKRFRSGNLHLHILIFEIGIEYKATIFIGTYYMVS